MNYFMRNQFGINDALKAGLYQDQSLVPACAWIKSRVPHVVDAEIESGEGKLKISWMAVSEDSVFRWVVSAEKLECRIWWHRRKNE